MKIALLADIHGNAYALSAVLEAAERAGAVRLLIAGDLTGYYPDVVSVLAMLDAWDWVSVGGNHEAMLKDWRNGLNRDVILNKYGSALKTAFEELSDQQIEMLVSLPSIFDVEIKGRRVRICHGTPWNRDEYAYPDAKHEVKEHFAEDLSDLVIFGHTHYPTQWQVGETLIVNPGSTGQPRDRKPGACWALWNVETNVVEFHREAYDMEKLIARCKVSDPNTPFLWNVLTRDCV
ncbi:metallophosphoesterase family protein [Kiloniella antarctica]|uniref:Metallophosphoesterase family protein n=1 Tax=Kiloniella antarctica TaxID=1550907 RepID=A0ABW5BPN2_9PROT